MRFAAAAAAGAGGVAVSVSVVCASNLTVVGVLTSGSGGSEGSSR